MTNATAMTTTTTETERISQSESQSSSSSSFLLLWSPTTVIKHKQHLRALFQLIAFVLLIGGALIVNAVLRATSDTQSLDTDSTTTTSSSRHLNEDTIV